MAQGPADGVLDTFKSLVFDPVVHVLIDRILSKAAWLAWGPIAYIVTKVITLVADALYADFRLIINFGAIRLMNAEHQAAYEKASISEYLISKDKGINSPEFRKARDENKQSLSKFVHTVLSNSAAAAGTIVS